MSAPRRPPRQGAKAYQICIRCQKRRQINWKHRLAPDHQAGVYICKYCKPKVPHDRYVNFDMAAYRRNWNLQRRYGITAEQYDQMLADQGGVCKICKHAPVSNRLHVDHDRACCPHIGSCGKCIRGLLCSSCNSRVEWWLTYHAEIGAYLKAGTAT